MLKFEQTSNKGTLAFLKNFLFLVMAAILYWGSDQSNIVYNWDNAKIILAKFGAYWLTFSLDILYTEYMLKNF